MSYILEALKKSDQERQIGHVPDIGQIQEAPRPVAPRWPRWLLIALLINALILLTLAWRIWDARDTAAPLASTPAAPAQPAAVMPAPPAPVAASVVPAPAVVAAPAPAAVAPLPVEAEQPAAAVQPTDEPLMEAVPDAEPLPASSVMVYADVPRLQDLPFEERARLPAPRIDVHVFAQEPERRFVLINLRKYQVGDKLEDGPTLEAILNDGIVLSHAGRQYRVDRP